MFGTIPLWFKDKFDQKMLEPKMNVPIYAVVVSHPIVLLWRLQHNFFSWPRIRTIQAEIYIILFTLGKRRRQEVRSNSCEKLTGIKV